MANDGGDASAGGGEGDAAVEGTGSPVVNRCKQRAEWAKFGFAS